MHLFGYFYATGPDLFTSGLFLVLVMRVVLTLGDERKRVITPG
jgi:hypothetical protein